VDTIRKIKEPSNKTEVQSFLGKINYLRQFISNLAGKLETLLPLVRLKHEWDFVWGVAQREAFKRIMPKAGAGFRMYIAATNRTLGAV
jgi:hypothetical protein